MKRVLITGSGSYVGRAVMTRLAEEPEKFQAEEISVHGEEWKTRDFSVYDCVFHVAGIAHVDPDPAREPEYMRVNRDLALEVAAKAKADGVGQFIFMSSAIVYGDSAPLGGGEAITLATVPHPTTFYGRSKLEAEEGLRKLEADGFAVAAVRAPMIYGPACRGNFPRLVAMARKLPVFPDVDNCRSMIYIGNLSELIAGLIKRGAGGLYLPQNADYSRTSDLVARMARLSGRSMRLTKAFNPLLKGPLRNHPLALKAFGSMWYDQAASDAGFDYRRYSLDESLALTLGVDGAKTGGVR